MVCREPGGARLGPDRRRRTCRFAAGARLSAISTRADPATLVLTHVQMERRSPSACRMQWLQHDHPRLNTSSKWAKDELKRLYEIVDSREDGVREENGGWEAVADELGVSRPFSSARAPRTPC